MLHKKSSHLTRERFSVFVGKFDICEFSCVHFKQEKNYEPCFFLKKRKVRLIFIVIICYVGPSWTVYLWFRRFSNGTHQACEGDTDSHRNFLLLTGSNKCLIIFCSYQLNRLYREKRIFFW